MKPKTKDHVLKNVSLCRFTHKRLVGEVVSHPNYEAGKWVCTSTIESGQIGDARIQTRNTLYTIESWAKDEE